MIYISRQRVRDKREHREVKIYIYWREWRRDSVTKSYEQQYSDSKNIKLLIQKCAFSIFLSLFLNCSTPRSDKVMVNAMWKISIKKGELDNLHSTLPISFLSLSNGGKKFSLLETWGGFLKFSNIFIDWSKIVNFTKRQFF